MSGSLTIEIAASWDRKIDRSGGIDACWPWTGSRTTGGYGASRVKMDGGWRSAGAHQIAHYLSTGNWERLSDGRVVRHLCHNPPCCNPRHLLGGSHQDNSDDQVARRRGVVLTKPRPLLHLPVTGVAYDWCPGMMTVDGQPHDVHRASTEWRMGASA